MRSLVPLRAVHRHEAVQKPCKRCCLCVGVCRVWTSRAAGSQVGVGAGLLDGDPG